MFVRSGSTLKLSPALKLFKSKSYNRSMMMRSLASSNFNFHKLTIPFESPEMKRSS
jgi:hypothetical protein